MGCKFRKISKVGVPPLTLYLKTSIGNPRLVGSQLIWFTKNCKKITYKAQSKNSNFFHFYVISPWKAMSILHLTFFLLRVQNCDNYIFAGPLMHFGNIFFSGKNTNKNEYEKNVYS